MNSDKETMQLEPELRALLRLSEWIEAQARRVLQAQEHNGLTVQDFARRMGIASWRLYKWRQRLRKVCGEAAPSKMPRFPRSSSRCSCTTPDPSLPRWVRSAWSFCTPAAGACYRRGTRGARQ